jgi:hypothetical protein
LHALIQPRATLIRAKGLRSASPWQQRWPSAGRPVVRL